MLQIWRKLRRGFCIAANDRRLIHHSFPPRASLFRQPPPTQAHLSCSQAARVGSNGCGIEEFERPRGSSPQRTIINPTNTTKAPAYLSLNDSFEILCLKTSIPSNPPNHPPSAATRSRWNSETLRCPDRSATNLSIPNRAKARALEQTNQARISFFGKAYKRAPEITQSERGGSFKLTPPPMPTLPTTSAKKYSSGNHWPREYP